MNERGEAAEKQTPGDGSALSPAQQAHQASYDQIRTRVQHLQAGAQAQRATKEFSTALKLLCQGADQLCAEAEAMPARMDEEAQARSQLLVRAAGAADLVITGVLVVLILLGALSRGWGVAVVLLSVISGGLLLGTITPPGTGHRQQRIPALASPPLAAVGVLVAVLTSWWLAAFLLFLAASFVVAIAVLPQPSSGQEGAR